jgi:hypothetical protein
MTNFDSKDKLIYDLIFSSEVEFKIDVSKYITDIYKYDKFINEIKKILKKSKVNLIREKINLDTNSVIWEIKVSR